MKCPELSLGLAALGICFLLPIAQLNADSMSEQGDTQVPELTCNRPIPSTAGFRIAEKRGNVTLWENELAERAFEFLLIDRDQCYVSLDASDYALTRLDKVVDATVTSFDPETAFPSVLGNYFEDALEVVDSRCGDIPTERGRTARNSISDFEYCSVDAIRHYLKMGFIWQFDVFEDQNIETISIYSFDGALIGGHIVQFADQNVLSEFSYRSSHQ